MSRNYITTDSSAELHQYTGTVDLYDETGYIGYKKPDARPMKTAADKIAAAARQGDICGNNMMALKDDGGGKLDAKGEKHTSCGFCRPADVRQFWKNQRVYQEMELDQFGTTWDPTIRL